MRELPWKATTETDCTAQFGDGLCHANHKHMAESRQGNRPFPGYGIPMKSERATDE